MPDDTARWARRRHPCPSTRASLRAPLQSLREQEPGPEWAPAWDSSAVHEHNVEHDQLLLGAHAGARLLDRHDDGLGVRRGLQPGVGILMRVAGEVELGDQSLALA